MFSNEQKNIIDENYYEVINLYADKKNELESFILNLDENEKYLLKYIYSNLPISDIISSTVETIFSFVKHSLFVKENTPWGGNIPLDKFLIDVAFPRVNTEKIENHRKLLYDIFAPYIEGIDNIYEAAVAVNYASLEYGTYRSPSRRTASPITFLKRTFGRCGEEATFLASVFKSLGIPARQIYTPFWAHCDDNHAWVEVYCDGKWHFMGACEPEPSLNRGWFNSASSRSMLLHVRAFDNLFQHDDKITTEGPALILNRTADYSETKRLTVEVFGENNQPIKNASVYFEIINYARYAPLSKIETDESGRASLVLGIGNVNIRVVKDGVFLEKLIHLKDTDFVSIDFSKAKTAKELSMEEPSIEDFTIEAPPDPGNFIEPLAKKQIELHKCKFDRALNLRDKREKESVSTLESVSFELSEEEKNKLSAILEKAKFGGEEIIKFVTSAKNKYAIPLLETLDEKDYIDCESHVLLNHLEYAQAFENDYPEELFISYVLAPRISFEEITPYRKFIVTYLDDETKDFFKTSPDFCWEYINDKVNIFHEKNFPGIVSDPCTTLEYLEGSGDSKNILFVAIMRTLGICARNNSVTNEPEYYKNGRFISPKGDMDSSSRLVIKCDMNFNWVYGTNWSLARLENGVYKPCKVTLKPYELFGITLPSGDYRLLTANRLPNGNTVNKKYCFTLQPNKIKEIAVELQKIDFSQMLIDIKLNDFWVKYKTEDIYISRILDSGKNLLMWIGPSQEPSEHILNEIVENKEFFSNSNINIIFILEDEKALENETIQAAVNSLPKIKICYDENFSAQEPVARNLYVDPSKLPLVMVTDEKLKAVYGFSGYKVGLANLLANIAEME